MGIHTVGAIHLFLAVIHSMAAVTWTVDATVSSNNASVQDPTSITTFNGSTYHVYVDPQRRMTVGKVTAGAHETVVVFPLEMGLNERWHICPTIGVDRNGYIHVCGDMHNDTWKYYISNNPEDIHGGFTRRHDLPGSKVTYPTIFYDNQRNLYLCYRQKGGRYHRAVMTRYDVDRDAFTVIGPPAVADGQPALIWSKGMGGEGCWYQKPGLRVHFDENDRMHVAGALINACQVARGEPGYVEGHNHHTTVLYACSDDYGETWHRADGAEIELPLTVDNASIVVDRPGQFDINGGSVEVGCFSSDRPVVGYSLSSNGAKYTRMWDGSDWVELSMPRHANSFMSRAGYTAWYDGSSLFYSSDGESFTVLEGSPAFPGGWAGMHGSLDREHFRLTGDYRYHAKFDNFTVCKVITIHSGIGEPLVVDPRPQAPFGSGATPLPGRVEAESYDEGGEAVAYHDSDAGNRGDATLRGDGVDLKDGGGGNVIVGWNDVGEWREYTVDIPNGIYAVSARTATTAENAQMKISLGNGPEGTDFAVLGTMDIAGSGSYDTFEVSTLGSVTVENGGNGKVLRFETLGDYFDIDWVEFSSGATSVRRRHADVPARASYDAEHFSLNGRALGRPGAGGLAASGPSRSSARGVRVVRGRNNALSLVVR